MDKTGQKWHKFLPRAALVGSLLKHCKDHLQIRQELREFMNEMKKDSQKTQEDLKDEDSVVREWYIRRKSNAASVGLTHRDLLMRHQVSRGYTCNFEQNFSLLCLFLNLCYSSTCQKKERVLFIKKMMSLELQFYGDCMHRNYLNWLISIKMTPNYELSMDVNQFIDMYHVVTEC